MRNCTFSIIRHNGLRLGEDLKWKKMKITEAVGGKTNLGADNEGAVKEYIEKNR